MRMADGGPGGPPSQKDVERRRASVDRLQITGHQIASDVAADAPPTVAFDSNECQVLDCPKCERADVRQIVRMQLTPRMHVQSETSFLTASIRPKVVNRRVASTSHSSKAPADTTVAGVYHESRPPR